jgi:signal transduction histidine kinase/CheY-like chemotaxis protein
MIDERKRAEEALQISHERFLTVLDSIDATIYVADMQTHEILFMNNHMIEAFGKDMTGEICWEVFRGESAPCPHCTNDQLIDDNGRPADVCVWQGENPITGKWYINYDRAIEWTDGRLVRLQIATDITNLKKMEEDLHQARKMEAVGILAGGIAHEFNNVLGIIIGNAEMALNDVEKWHPLNQNLSEIKSASLRARDVVKQLLNFSRKVDTYREPIDMRVIVKEALKLLKPSIPSNIEIQDIFPTELDAVVADSTQIHQLLINLCNNASQAMSNEGGTLKIELNNVTLDYEKASKLRDLKPGAYVRLSVSDTGGGIPRKFLDKIFDPYFTTKDVGKGTGMGLAVVHGIVRTHDGAIRADSHLGKGTVFDIYFPSSSEEVSQETKRDAKVPTGKEKIIFVDDEISIVKLYSNMLERLGYSVISETDPLRVVEHFQSNPLEYDLVISDMTMPNLTGDRLAEELIEIRPDIPIIVCTGFSEKMSPERAQEIGIKEVLMKPIQMKDLGNLVRKLLDEVKSGK